MTLLTRRAFSATALLLLGGAGPTLSHQRPVLAAVPIDRLSTPWWRRRHEEKLAELKRGPVDLIFLGDSITQNWEKPDYQPSWRRFYGDRHAVNLGFVGDATSHLLWRMRNGELDAIAPKVAVVLIGANNLGLVHWPADDDVKGIDAVVAELRMHLPRTRILLLGVLPSERSAWVSQTTLAINRQLAARYGHGAVPDVTYMDLTGIFMRDGQLDLGLFADPAMHPPQPALHPSPQGQERLAAAIEPTLAALLGDRNHLAK
jgi:lysophospholipase L1-like esterase